MPVAFFTMISVNYVTRQKHQNVASSPPIHKRYYGCLVRLRPPMCRSQGTKALPNRPWHCLLWWSWYWLTRGNHIRHEVKAIMAKKKRTDRRLLNSDETCISLRQIINKQAQQLPSSTPDNRFRMLLSVLVDWSNPAVQHTRRSRDRTVCAKSWHMRFLR